MKKTVIFDLDGTLTDTIEDLADATNFALKFYGYPAHKIEEYKYFIGNGAKKLVQRAAPKDIDEDKVSALLEKFFEYYRAHYLDKTKLYEGVSEVIETLISRGIKLGVRSNKPHEMTQKVVEALLPNCFVEVIGQDSRFPIKPDASAIHYIIKKCESTPEDTVFVGDSGVDMQTAKNSGTRAVGVSWGFRTRDELFENGADLVADTPEELLNIILEGAKL